MAAHRLTEIRCDGPAAGIPCRHDAAVVWSGTNADVRRKAIDQGWRITRVDQCPDCRPDRQPRTGGEAQA